MSDDVPPPLEEDNELPPDLDDLDIHDVVDTGNVAAGGEEKTVMDEMIEAASVARKKKEKKKAKARAKADKTFGKGLKKGFFNTQPKKKVTKKKKKKDDESDVAMEITTDAAKKLDKKAAEEMPYIRKKTSTENPLDSLRFPEVQQAMKNTMENKSQWMTPNLLERFAKNPKLALGLQNPRFVKAMEELQKDPQAAMDKYKDDEALQDFLQEFMGLMGDHMVNLGEDLKEKEEREKKEAEKEMERKKEEMRKEIAKKDPEVAKVLANQDVASILADPEMQKIMRECTQPGVLRKYMQNPEIAKKFRLLQQHGLIQIQGF